MKEIHVDSKIENIPEVMDFVRAELEALGCSEQVKAQFKMAVDELFGNICLYAYGEGAGPVTVSVGLEGDPPSAAVAFCDSGSPYNPLEADLPDIELDIEDRPVGGLGIFLIREMMDSMSYEYKDGCNVLKLTRLNG
ncbi:MAG: ATP-binding protein [Clostridiales bacterium]|nr:ATP-binding protein [Clostridiales bacterium]